MIIGDVLWLAYERSGHPECVRYPASEDEVRFVCGLLQGCHLARCWLSQGLRNYLREESQRDLFSRRTIPVRGANGLHRLVPWKLARWLEKALLTEGSVWEEIDQKLKNWLSTRSTCRERSESKVLERLAITGFERP